MAESVDEDFDDMEASVSTPTPAETSET